jgi:hypothetical protein
MVDISALHQLRNRRFFEGWDGFRTPAQVTASEASIRELVDDLITLGPSPGEVAARRVVEQCVRRFNELDDGWICTIEREDIGDCIHDLVELCGFAWDEDWLDEADW